MVSTLLPPISQVASFVDVRLLFKAHTKLVTGQLKKKNTIPAQNIVQLLFHNLNVTGLSGIAVEQKMYLL